jgi:exodeoxyribonuclease V beta subunit
MSAVVGGEERTDPRVDRPVILDGLRDERGNRMHAVIEASAGTGKTHTLEHLVIDLLLEGTPIDRILVVTFTEKATLEMRARIRARIAALVAAGRKELRAALLDFDRAPISTIHAFCQRLLAEHAFGSGRLLEQQRIDPREAFGRGFRDALRRGLAAGAPERSLLEGALRVMRPAQLESVLWKWSHVRCEIRPRFDGAAIEGALLALPSAIELEGATGRAILGSIGHPTMRARAREILAGLAPMVEQVRDAGVGERAAVIEAIFPRLLEWASDAAHHRSEPSATYLASALGEHPVLGEPVRVLASAVATPLPALVHRVLPALLARLDEDKRRRGRFDFDDMLRLVHEALHGPRGDALVTTLRARYRFALVDEFQDTDPIQWAIFRRLFFEGEGRTLFVIGDPKQSIYSFRSADVHTYLAAQSEIEAAGGVRLPLVDCYRSTPQMISAINRVLESGFFTGPNRYPHPVRCGRPSLAARDDRDAAPIQLLHLIAKDRLRAKPMRFALAGAIAEEIERLLAGGIRVSDRSRDDLALRALAPSDVFVLTRTTKEALEVADALRRRGIPHALSTQQRLFETAEARDVLDVLRALEDPGSRARRLRAFLSSYFAVSLDELDASRDLGAEHPYLERLARWTALAREQRFAALFQAMIDESGLARRLLFLREGERELTNHLHVLEALLGRASRLRLGLGELTAQLASLIDGVAAIEEEDVQRLESERAAVQLLTMHKSKGLEAEVVFLFGGMTRRPAGALEPRIFHEGHLRCAWLGEPPDEIASRVVAEEREEDERLLYVAMTRARSRLYLPYVGPAPTGQALPPGHVSSFERLAGAYRVLDDRLIELAAAGAIAEEGTPGAEITRRTVSVTGMRRRIAVPPPLPAIAPGDRAERELAPVDLGARFAALRDRSRGLEVTSYTRMKAGRTRALAADGIGADEPASWMEELAREPHAPPPDDDDPLPSGTAFGVLVHEVLESIEDRVVRAAAAGDALLEDPATRALFEEAADRNGIDRRTLPGVAELVHRTLRTAIHAEGLALPLGFAALERRVREMPFLHPIPERAHPRLGTWLSRLEATRAGETAAGETPAREAVERGFVRGVIDLLFEHEGMVWVLDWKTDRLPSYDASALAEHAGRHYDVQAKLYALGVARMMKIDSAREHEARFGGLVYCFVRGIRDRASADRSTPGIHVARPGFEELEAWDRALREEAAPFGYPLPARRGHAESAR